MFRQLDKKNTNGNGHIGDRLVPRRSLSRIAFGVGCSRKALIEGKKNWHDHGLTPFFASRLENNNAESYNRKLK